MVFIDAETLTVRQAALVGLAQTLALLPGFSRSGVTMAGGLVAGLRHQEAARFSFLLATPIIAGAGLLEVQQLGAAGPALASYLLGAVAAGIAAYLSGRFLVRFLRTGRLDPFGWYCLAAGAAGLLLVR
jgi:undecaprenyl-diphosphatase